MRIERLLNIIDKAKKLIEPKFKVTYPDGLDGVVVESGLNKSEVKKIIEKHTEVRVYPQ